jgi:hypothetical protein
MDNQTIIPKGIFNKLVDFKENNKHFVFAQILETDISNETYHLYIDTYNDSQPSCPTSNH